MYKLLFQGNSVVMFFQLFWWWI